jgi:hypothetical protein
MTDKNQNSRQVSTRMNFNIVGDDEQAFVGMSQSLSTKDLSFTTDAQLKKGMLLQVTMASHQHNSPSLQTMVEVVKVSALENETDYHYHIDSNIKDITTDM